MGIIDKERFIASLDSRHSVMFAHIFDMAQLSLKRSQSVYGDFLSENSISTLLCREKYLPLKPVLFGGVRDAQRKMVAFIDEYDGENYPIGAIKITSPMLKSLSHRDFLGSIMGLGLKREKLGDIIILDDACYVILSADIAAFVSTSLTKVGRVGVKCQEYSPADIILPEKSFTPIKGTVSTMRLDALVSLFTGKSRGNSADLVRAGFVFVNGILSEKCDLHLQEGDTLSVRGYGKAVVAVGGKSKKDRTFVTLNKFS